MFQNETKNQHFISQVEQRLNASNRFAKTENQRIYEFKVVDRDVPLLRLVNANGRLIERSLSFNDLFSFDAAGHSKLRSNLEALFGQYEQDLGNYSQGLLQKLRSQPTPDIKKELLNLFAGKFLNFLRNPNSVTKVLNTVGAVADYRPTDSSLLKAFSQVQRGSRPHQKVICNTFGLDEGTYERWLKMLFLLLTKQTEESLNLFEMTIKNLFESSFVVAQVYEYTNPDPHQICLLSDRGFNVPIQSDSSFAFEFNVTSRAFVRFAFFNPQDYVPKDAPPEVAERVVTRAKATINVTRFENDLPALVVYNKLTVYQCALYVLGADSSPLLHV